MASVSAPDPLHDIQLAIGRFVVHCTELEFIAFAAIHQLEPDAAVAKGLADSEFHERVKSLLSLSTQRTELPDREEWIGLWERVCSLTGDRNAILHNPMMFEVWVNNDDELRVEIRPRVHVFRKRRPQEKPLTIESLRAAADKAQRYSVQAWRLWSTVFPGASLFEESSERG